MSDRFHIVLYMSLVDDQRLHAIVRLLFVFYHAQRKPLEGSLDEECASTAANGASLTMFQMHVCLKPSNSSVNGMT